MARLRLPPARARASWSCSRPPRTPRSPTSKRSTRTVRTAATCSTATGCSGSTPTDQGVKQRWMRSASTAGWSTVKVPNVWNLGDASNESMAGGIGWYRKDFELPSADCALEWAFRFESVNYRARVWLNGRRSARTRGAYLPFEVPAATALKRRGTNRLVVRVDSQAPGQRLPARRDRTPTASRPAAGGTTAASSARSTCSKLDTVDFQQRPGPARRSPAAPATRACAWTGQPAQRHRRGQRVTVTGKFGDRNVNLGHEDDRAGGDRRVHQRDQDRQAAAVVAAEPEPLRRLLHRPRRRRTGRGLRPAQRHPLDQGLPGQLFLNGAPLNIRGMGLHEDSKAAGLRDRQRAPRGAGQPHQGSRRHGAAHALPVPSRTRMSSRTGSAC